MTSECAATLSAVVPDRRTVCSHRASWPLFRPMSASKSSDSRSMAASASDRLASTSVSSGGGPPAPFSGSGGSASAAAYQSAGSSRVSRLRLPGLVPAGFSSVPATPLVDSALA